MCGKVRHNSQILGVFDMFRLLIPVVLIIAFLMPGFPVLVSEVAGAAFAEGGRGPVDKIDTKKPGKKVKKAAKKGAKKKQDPKTFVPATLISKHDSVNYIQEDLEAEAKRDNLKRMATSRKHISALRAHIDTAFIATQGSTARNEPNRINQQLAKYRSQKTNTVLRGYARALIGAIAADRADMLARDLLTRYRAAEKAGEDLKAALIKSDYEEARRHYYGKVRQLPEPSRKLFKGLPQDPSVKN
ncbi:hypothetical protein O4H61_07790 [Roseovarius aestuarii]|nr:hypothetical protein [Roseovarius aestuarii]